MENKKFDEVLLWLYNSFTRQNTKEKKTKGWILPFSKKEKSKKKKNVNKVKIFLNAIASKVKILCLYIISDFGEINLYHRSWSSVETSKEHMKKFEVTQLFVFFFKVFDSIHRWKMEQILFVCALPQRNCLYYLMMLYKNIRAKIHSFYGNKFFIDIVAGVLQRDTWTPYTFFICLDYV